MSEGQAFQFTPGGIQPLMQQTGSPGAVINAADAVAQMRAAADAQVSAVAPTAKVAKPVSKLARRSYAKELRERLRVVEREIKNLEWLQAEAVKLRRMLAAAKQPPATVADIHKSRKSG